MKIPIKQYKVKVNNINKKIESTYISSRNNSKNCNIKKNNLSFTKSNFKKIKNNWQKNLLTINIYYYILYF